VSADGSTIIAGAPFNSTSQGNLAGVVYIFVKPGAAWANGTETAQLTALDGTTGTQLGTAVATSVDGSTVAASAAGTSSVHSAVYVFAKPTLGWAAETQTAKLTGSDTGTANLFGSAVAISSDGSTIIAGDGLNNSSRGAAYVFVKPAAGGWITGTETTKLTASDSASGDEFGRSVSVSSDGLTIAVGAPFNSPNKGAAYVFGPGLASPTVSASAPSSGTTGTAIAASSVSASLASGSVSTGTITFKVFGPQSSAPSDCSGGTTVGTASVSGNGTYNSSDGFTPSQVGDYWWYASYGGDVNNHTAASTCGAGMSETVVKAGPSLGSVSAPASATAGTAIPGPSVSASLAGGSTPSGTITFKVFGPLSSAPSDCSGGTTVGTATVSGNGPYSPSAGFTPSTVGDYWWYASYDGDSSNNAADSGCGAGMAETVVGSASPSLGSVGAPSSGTAGSAIDASSISAFLSGGVSPSGTVTFKVFGPQPSAPSDCSGGTAVGTASVSGNGTYNPSAGFTPSQAGGYWWYASYVGDANNDPGASSCGVGMTETVVGRASPSLGSVGAPLSGTAGTAISGSAVSVALSGGVSPSGTVTFKVFGPQGSAPSDCSGGTAVGTASVSANGTYNSSAGFTPSSAGDYWWYASYSGDANNDSAASACAAGMAETVVAPASPSLGSVGAPPSGTAGTAILASSVSASLAGGSAPSGTVTFKVFGPQPSAPSDCSGGTAVGTASVSGNGTYDPSAGFTPSQVGDYWWHASYGGDANNNAADSGCGAGMAETVVGPASPSLGSVAAPSSGTAGTANSEIDAALISASLSGGASPSGTITFKVFGPQPSAPSDCSGGTKVGTATVSGNGTYSPSAGFTPPSAGDYWWYASYGGDDNNNAAASTCAAGMAKTVVKASPSLSAVGAPQSGTAGSAIDRSSISAALSHGSSPTGTVTFKVFGPQPSAPSDCTGGTTVGTASVSGNGTYSPSAGFTPSSAGDYWWYASYGGDSLNNVASSGCGALMADTAISPVLPPPPGPPQLSHLRVSPRAFSLHGRRVGGRCIAQTASNRSDRRCSRPINLTISYELDGPATVTITIEQLQTGRHSGGRCVAQTAKNRKQPSCTRVTAVPGTLTDSGSQGPNRSSFNGRIGGHALGQGRYRLTATPNSNTAPGTAQSAGFTITS
jgi:glyoxylate utilization-related uncharacterized protein